MENAEVSQMGHSTRKINVYDVVKQVGNINEGNGHNKVINGLSWAIPYEQMVMIRTLVVQEVVQQPQKYLSDPNIKCSNKI